jgi:oligopeptide/dipeptide ABC transporter ATP-binding protein
VTEQLLEVVDLVKHFPLPRNQRVHAVDGITFNIAAGETLGMVGESGCGKTTAGRAIVRLIEPDRGRLIYRGQDITHLAGAELLSMRRRMQIIFQDPYSSLDPRKSAGQLIAEPLLIHRWGTRGRIRERVRELLEQVGLTPDMVSKYPHELDGGRCQRIGIARALALGPEFIVCDEPVSALDVSIQAQILNLMKDLQERLSLTYLFISHNLAVVKHISDRVVVMYLGVVVETAPTEALFEDPLHPYTQALLSAIPIPAVGERRSRIILSGDVPTPVNPGPGCRFHKRCWLASPVCGEAAPKMVDAGGGHLVACFRVSEGAVIQ